MTTDTSANSKTANGSSRPGDLPPQFVCPYCGAVNEVDEGACPNCTMENSAAGRKATKARIGPWYVLQKRNPAAPGMRFETLLSFVHRGRIKAHSIVRGPTSHQLWRFAAQVKGLSREFGLCYSCGSQLATDATVCPKCNRSQLLPAFPDAFLESDEGNAAPAGPTDAPAADAAESSSARPAETILPDEVEDPQSNGDDAGHDIIVPSLQEADQPPAVRPSGPRERLSNLRRDRIPLSQRFEPPFNQDALDDDEVEALPAPQVGPTFVAPARPMGPPPRRRMWIEAFIFLLVLAVAAVSGLFYVDPHLQAQAQFWVNKGLQAVGIDTESKPPDGQITPPPDGTSAPIAGSPLTPAATPHSSVVTPPPETPIAVAPNPLPSNEHVVPPAPSPALPDTTTHAPPPPPATHIDAAPAVPDVAPAAEPAPQEASSSPPSDGSDDPFERSRALRRLAMDAATSGNYAKAVQLFEQIKELPREAWPGDLELRLKAAKANAEGAPRQ